MAAAAEAAATASIVEELPHQEAAPVKVAIEEEAAAEGGDAFEFASIPGWGLSFLKDSSNRELWSKWGLAEWVTVQKFSFGRKLDLKAGSDRRLAVAAFLRDLFSSPVVRAAIPVVTRSRARTVLSGGVISVEFEELLTTQTSMGFFDRLETEGIVTAPMWDDDDASAASASAEYASKYASGREGAPRERAGGYIRKQFDVIVDGVTCQDQLRDVLVNPDTEHVGVSASAS
jgi:hypothetical protein